ncbi:hypothetical protein TRIUR3_19756 [Triticum urartu]|uniref:Uncharacterized protein n=1 Tax=Triticum urartu TaxID=4572 RepID=M7ZDV1_TRIUA|nr:hypothetical protein TRIUR3_19756 [Triticum urartu]
MAANSGSTVLLRLGYLDSDVDSPVYGKNTKSTFFERLRSSSPVTNRPIKAHRLQRHNPLSSSPRAATSHIYRHARPNERHLAAQLCSNAPKKPQSKFTKSTSTVALEPDEHGGAAL